MLNKKENYQIAFHASLFTKIGLKRFKGKRNYSVNIFNSKKVKSKKHMQRASLKKCGMEMRQF